jgi:glycosyltransferase involved in cell wall biosynthesis
MRLLIASTLDSSQPFGPFTRPFYLGMYLTKQFEVCHVGLDCSAVHYAQAISVGSRSLRSYIQTIRQSIENFHPDIIYAQETLPSIAALISILKTKHPKPSLVFDFHTLSAFEYWTQFPSASNKLQQLKQLIKTYLAQGSLIYSGRPIIAASQSTINLIPKWYAISPSNIRSVGNGITEDLLQVSLQSSPDPFAHLRPAKIVAVIAPKASDYDFPSNDMSVATTIEVAKQLVGHRNIHLVVIGRDPSKQDYPLSSNITFTGFLPNRASFITHLAHVDIGLLPFPKEAVAGGARNKALDYFACKKLVVSTPEGLRGLEEFQHQRHVLVTQYSTQNIADTISEACLNYDRYEPLATAAYQLVQQKYSWFAMAEKVATILKSSTLSAGV